MNITQAFGLAAFVKTTPTASDYIANLLAWLPLQSDASDHSSAGTNSGTLIGSPSFSTVGGKTGISLNGTSQTVHIANLDGVPLANYTVMAWAYLNSGSTSESDIFDRSLLAGNFDQNWLLGTDSSGGFWRGQVRGISDQTTALSPSALSQSVWTHVTMSCSYDGTTATVMLYVNNVLVSTASMAQADFTMNAQSVYIGSYAGAANWFGGLIRHARLYSATLTQANIQAAMIATQ